MMHYAILAILDDKAMPRSGQERQLISATCLPRTLVVTSSLVPISSNAWSGSSGVRVTVEQSVRAPDRNA